MKYAVIKSGGKQYKIREGDVITVEKIDKSVGKKDNPTERPVEFEQVLLLVDDGKAKIGQPLVGAKVKGKIIDQQKGKKIDVFKYTAKTGYHRKIGHRQLQTRVLIEKIESKDK